MCLRIGRGIGGFRSSDSQANDRWEMKVTGPNAFERSYTLEGSTGQHEPQIIGKLVAMMVPGRNS